MTTQEIKMVKTAKAFCPKFTGCHQSMDSSPPH